MSRTMSAAAVRSLFAQESEVVWLQLLTISGPGTDTIRIVNNPEPIGSRGHLYEPFPFECSLPQDAAERESHAQLTISNVDRVVVERLRTMDTPLTAVLEFVTSLNPHEVECGPFEFEILGARADRNQVVAQLGYEPILTLPFPRGKYDPQRFPNIFGRSSNPL